MSLIVSNLKLQLSADFHAPVLPRGSRSQSLLVKPGRFPVARRHGHYYQIEQQLIQSC